MFKFNAHARPITIAHTGCEGAANDFDHVTHLQRAPTAALLTVLVLAFTLSGCLLLPQKRATFSHHSAASGEIHSFSYPASLRASTIHMGIDPSIPEHAMEKLIKLREQLEGYNDELARADTNEVNDLTPKIEATRKEIGALQRVWMRPRILAEPPPDVANNLTFKITPRGNDQPASAPEIDLGATSVEITRAVESDVKRHLAYRINEALFNEPERIGGELYKTLMLALIQQSYAPQECASSKTADDAPQPDTSAAQ
ncbi:hypothetical protein [Alcanivorax quisquiliarum]|uniref:Lipoprotein n=1 Tax=Alcanivorax quisquiliarum TaxID=2933565 RepID=A0ABT0E4K0_9GAMM|nr:hypothetical protein [Alcanivorax quisquiliarum]MCK0536624.1 hypothetical protein [Alcanivorax quisquiliarum]